MSLRTMRVSGFRRLQGKNLHFGRIKRQFPKYGLKSRQTVCERMAFSSALRTSRAPSSRCAAAVHALSTASSCACGWHIHVSISCLLSPPLSLFQALCPRFLHLFLPFHVQSVLRPCRLLLGARRCCLPSSPFEELVLAPGLLRAILSQPLAIFTVGARAS
eukprot:1679775-Pleurochrysis_carterae.AAC.1